MKSKTELNTEIFAPSSAFVNEAHINKDQYREMSAYAQANYLNFWGDKAHNSIVWHKEFTKVFDDSNAPFYKWFTDGELNVSYNSLDKHLPLIPDKVAIIFVADSGDTRQITYQALYHEVCKFANGLKHLGVKRGDRVILYLPNSIEGVVAMQACARIGAVHSVVFGGFSAKALSERIIDANAKIIITGDAQERGGKVLPLKAKVDEAIALLHDTTLVNHVVVNKFTHTHCEFDDTRDVWWHDLVSKQDIHCNPEMVDSEHPLFILYTSGSTGKPKGVVHSSSGYILGAIYTMKSVFDVKAEDTFWCTADIGWITGHTYVAYGPLLMGVTQVIFDGIPTYPDASRFWQIIEHYQVSIFYTAPTAIRTLIKLGADLPRNFNLSSLRLLGTVGEPINPEAWKWYYQEVGNRRCPIVDTWWQTETGAHVIAPMPGVVPLKPGSCTKPLIGMDVAVIDQNGNSCAINEEGYLVIKHSYPFQIRNIWGDPEKYRQTYYPANIANGKYYVSGDAACIDDDGYYWIMGRTDDVLNVSGHRLGTMEIESAITAHNKIAEAAVVGRVDAIKGEAVFAFVVGVGNAMPADLEIEVLKEEIIKLVNMEIGAIAKPDYICFVPALPKTRSGKIMRRLLRSLVNGQEIVGDTSTLENPDIVDRIRQLIDINLK